MDKTFHFSRVTRFLVVAACGAAAASATFAASADVTREAARSTALAAVPGGAVQSAELETEHGRRIWSFDIKDARSPDVVEIQIDARTGAVVSKTIESPRDQKREAVADRKSKR
ncbi:MAG: PepSY domain-containing protein [Caldimonas sp.]